MTRDFAIPGWGLWQATPDCALHVFVAGSASDGPTVLVTGGVHGDEYEGPAAIARLASELAEAPLQGRVLLVPVVNPLARLGGTRSTPEDGLNLARNFPGRADGSPTERLADAVARNLLSPADYLIDLHSGGVEYVFAPVSGFYGAIGDTNPSWSAARAFGLPTLWQLPSTRGVLSYEANRQGKIAIGCEYLGAGQLAAGGVEAYALGVMRCLIHWGLLRPSVDPPEMAEPRVLGGDWMVSATTGLFVAHVSLGEDIAAGTLLATIKDERGAELQRFAAAAPGTILALRNKAHIVPGVWAVLLCDERRA